MSRFVHVSENFSFDLRNLYPRSVVYVSLKRTPPVKPRIFHGRSPRALPCEATWCSRLQGCGWGGGAGCGLARWLSVLPRRPCRARPPGGVPGDGSEQGPGAAQVEEGAALQRQERRALRGHQPHHPPRQVRLHALPSHWPFSPQPAVRETPFSVGSPGLPRGHQARRGTGAHPSCRHWRRPPTSSPAARAPGVALLLSLLQCRGLVVWPQNRHSDHFAAYGHPSPRAPRCLRASHGTVQRVAVRLLSCVSPSALQQHKAALSPRIFWELLEMAVCVGEAQRWGQAFWDSQRLFPRL